MNIVAKMNNPYLRKQLQPPDHTIQGFFIVSADGRSYDWMNDSDPNEVKSFLEKGLNWFHSNRSNSVTISDAEINEPFSTHPPADAAVIRVFSRIRPVPAGSGKLNDSVGRDHMWIFANEVQEILCSDTDSSFQLPVALTNRMIRFHLIDNVRGEPDMWKKSDVKASNFACKLVKDGTNKSYQFVGVFTQLTNDQKRGLDGKIFGEFEIDSTKHKVIKWRAYATGLAFGRSTFTPGEPKGKFPLSIAMIETDDEISKIVPPQAVSYGADYHDAQW